MMEAKEASGKVSPMSRKTSETPRRLYVHGGTVHVLFEGKRYAAPKSSVIADNLADEVFIVKMESNGGRARVSVVSVDTSEVEVWKSWKLS